MLNRINDKYKKKVLLNGMPYQMKEIVRCIKILKTITCVFMLFVLIATVRLVNGDSCSGRVEVLYNGSWGTVCDDGWDLTDAAAVCREVGCGDVIEAKSAAHFGQGSGPVWISDLQCSDTDSRLRDCKSSGWGRGSCGHEKDAGVICKGKSKPFNSIRCSQYRIQVFVYVLYGQPVSYI